MDSDGHGLSVSIRGSKGFVRLNSLWPECLNLLDK